METQEMLMAFGLTRQEATIYLSLFAEEAMTGYEIAKSTGISRSNVYAALSSMQEKGALYLIEGKAAKYTPVALNEFCENRIETLREIKKKLIFKIPKERIDQEGYITIQGFENIFNKVRQMILQAEERIYLSLSGDILLQLFPLLQEKISAGIKVVLLTREKKEFPGAIVYRNHDEQGQIRMIIDSKKVITGDIGHIQETSCLYSQKKNLVDLFKDALKNEIEIFELKKGR